MMTDDMTRLCGEIVAMRHGRGALRDGLVRDRKDRNRSVFQFCAHTRSARAETAQRTKTERLTFLHNLQRGVNAQRREMRRDLAGARKVWAGAGA
jgi:hypothetical protein